LLLAANAFFVAAEFALVKSRGFRIQSRADHGSRAARLTVEIHRNLDTYLGACQLGITMASLGLGWIGEPAVAVLLEPLFHKLGLSDRLLHAVSFLVGFLIFSSLHIVVGEQIPKTYAIRQAEPVAVGTAYLLRGFYVLIYPLNWTLSQASNGILRLLGIEPAVHDDVLTNEELCGPVDTSSKHGELEVEKAELLHNLFEIDQRSVSQIMVPRPEVDALNLRDSSEAHIKTMLHTRRSRLPVVDGDQDNLVGVLLIKDIYHEVLQGKLQPWQNLRQYLREPLVIPEISPISNVFESLRGTSAPMACVVDEYGVFTGIVTLEDLIEEIVGDVSDEPDTRFPDHPVVENKEGWIAHGLTPLSDVARITGLKPASGVDANTLSGLFMYRLGRIPRLNDEIIENGYRLRVAEMGERRVQQSVIRPPEASEPLDAKQTAAADEGKIEESEPDAEANT
jgi:CBS domain containing-hemolysin-like protein